MTRIEITRKDGRIIKAEAVGHTGYAKAGEDIVCASLSSIVQTAALGLLLVAGIPIDYKTDEKKGYLKIELPEALTKKQEDDAKVILETMLCGISDFYTDYSDYIELVINNK